MKQNYHRIKVMLAVPLPFKTSVLDYGIVAENDAPPEVGQIVIAPLAARKVAGVIAEICPDSDSNMKLRDIIGRPDLPPIKPETMEFIQFAAEWTMAPLGAVLKMMLPNPEIIKTDKIKTDLMLGFDDYTHQKTHELNPQQAKAAAELVEALVGAKGFMRFVLDGVTGSGKTETYLEAVAECIKNKKQALILLPEIALTQGIKNRLKGQFGSEPIIWNSAISPSQRKKNFYAITSGKAPIIIGARSAVFLPYRNLGLIIVDEEHDHSFKQQEQTIYHGRDMAIARAKYEDIPIVLSSATPSLETEANIRQGRYQRLVLDKRVGLAVMPDIEIIDLNKHRPERNRWIAQPLIEKIKQTLAEKKQAMLFLNRRGYAPFTICRECGNASDCPDCDTWLVAHKKQNRLRCHHCGYNRPMRLKCSKCDAEDAIVLCGPGVERIAAEAEDIFKDARIAVLSSDLIGSPKELEEMTDAIINNDIDIIIGTQMITKGHHFPHLKLVGIIDADLGLAGGDLRAAEKTWQMLAQVAGRAGRVKDKGTAIIQTYHPNEKLFKTLAAGGREDFIKDELQRRKEANMPPYKRLAKITLSAKNRESIAKIAEKMKQQRPNIKGVKIIGPAQPPIPYLRGNHRLQFFITTEKNVKIQAIIRQWIDNAQIPTSIRCQIDIDPYQFI